MIEWAPIETMPKGRAIFVRMPNRRMVFGWGFLDSYAESSMLHLGLTTNSWKLSYPASARFPSGSLAFEIPDLGIDWTKTNRQDLAGDIPALVAMRERSGVRAIARIVDRSLWDNPATIGIVPIPQNIARIDRELARVLAEQDRLLEAP